MALVVVVEKILCVQTKIKLLNKKMILSVVVFSVVIFSVVFFFFSLCCFAKK